MSRHGHQLRLVSSEVTRTHCPYCAFQCGMTISRQAPAGASLSIQADPAFPVNRGQMCIKGFTSAALLEHSERLVAPLLRNASGKLVPASWESALDFIAERLLALRARFGPASVAAFGSGALTNEKAYLLGKFVRLVLGSPNIDYNGRYCMASAAAGQNRAFGLDRGLPFPVSDIAEAQTLLLWGSNCAETMPPIMQWVFEQQSRGGKLIVVDPRRTDTARAASLHLQPTPGSDLALANGLLQLAIEDKLIDLPYIEQRTEGFEAVRRSVLTSSPAHVERLTGVSIEQQLQAVRWLAAERSMALSGRGLEQQSKGTDTVLALINLMLALGKVGKPASGYGCLTGQGNGQGGREHGQKADQLPGYRHIEEPQHRAEVARVWGVAPEELPGKGKSAYELLDALGPAGGIRGLLVFGSNVAVASPNSGNVVRKLKELELLVVCDAFENETSSAAHVLLPTTQWADDGLSLPADLIVLACGVRPRVEVARASRLPVNKGIVVNDTLATSVPGIYAFGECAEHRGKTYGIVAPVWEQAVVLADVLCGSRPQARYRGSKLYTRLKVAGVDVASMGCLEPELESDEVYQVIEERRGAYRKLVVRDGRLIGAMLVGNTAATATLVQLFDRDDPLPEDPLQALCQLGGGGAAANAEDRLICNCHRVSERALREAIMSGADSLAVLAERTRAGTGCGSCKGELGQLIGSLVRKPPPALQAVAH